VLPDFHIRVSLIKGASMRKHARIKLARIRERANVRESFIQQVKDGTLPQAVRSELEQLGASLKERQLHPIWVDTLLTIIVGHQRVAAGLLVGVEELDGIITDENLTPTDITLIQADENWHRKQLSDWQKFVICRDLLAENPSWDFKRLSEKLHVSQSTITRITGAARCVPAALEAFQAGRLGVTDMYCLAKAADEQEQHELLKQKLVGGASRDELERTVRRNREQRTARKRPAKVTPPPVAAAPIRRATVRLPSGLNVTVSGKSLGYAEFLEAIAGAEREAKQAQLANIDFAAFAESAAPCSSSP
jgi:ParB-like chromosome segregation protein Spo0J